MSAVDSILQDAINSGLQMPTPVNKKQDVDRASQEKKASLPSVTAEQLAKLNGYSIAAGRMSGAGLDTAGPLERDLMTLSGDDLRTKYGMEVGNQLVDKRLTGLKSFVNDKTTTRDDEGVASDLVSGTGLALGNTFGGIAAFGMGAMNSEAGVRAATDLQKMNETVQGTQSLALQNRRRANAAIDELYKRDNKAKYDEESKNAPIIAGLQRFGRDFLDMAGTALSDPVTGSDVLSSTMGSILAAGPLSKGLSTIGNAVTKMAPESVSKAARGISLAAEMDRGLGALSPARALTGMVPSSINLSIAAMEAGGAYQQTAAQIANMDLKELYDNSPDFRRMTMPVEEGGEGLTPERAQIILASRAGMMAGGIQGPLAMGTAKLTGVGKFESSPFSVPSAKGAISNLTREGFEETIQSATGQGSQNIATKRYADENKDLLDDVGGQAALGLIGGIGAAGVTQAPGFAGAAVGAAGRATGRAVLGSVDALGSVAAKRAAANQAANESTSTVADAAVRQATDEAMAQAPQAEQVMRDAIDQTDSSPEVKQTSNTFVDNLMSATKINPTEIEDPNIPQVVKSVLSGSTDKFDAMQKLSDVIQGTNEPTADTLSAAITLRIMQQNLEDVIMSDPAALGSLPDGHPAKQAVRQYGQLLQDMVNTPKVQRALRQAQDIIDELTAANTTKPITEERLDTAEGQQDLQNALGVAALAPDKADLATNQTILTHAENGKIKLTVPQLQALMTSNAILQAAQNATQEQEALGHKKQIDAVSQQVQVNPDPKAPKLSAVAHATAVFEAMRRRNPTEARAKLQEFGKFIQHFDNKLKALNQYVTKGGPKPTYQALNPKNREWYASTWLPKIHMHDANSIELAQRMSIEAQRLVDIYNGLSTAFPELKGGQAKVASLVQSLQGKPQEIADRTKAQRQGKTITPAPTPTPAPKKPVVRIRADTNVPAATPTVATTTAVTDTPPSVVPTITSTVPATTATSEASSPQENVTTGAVVEVKPQGLASVYLKLVGTEPGSKINNWFLRAFKLPNEQKTRIIATETPLANVRDALSSGEALSAFTGSEGALDMPSELSKAYRSYIKTGDGIITVLEKRLKAYMAKTSASGDDAGKTMLSSFLSGTKPTNEYRTGKMLNITEQVGDTIQYNQELLEAAVLAGLQWRLSSHQSETPMNEDDAASIMNISKDDVDQNLLDILEQGLTAVTAKRTLANKIRQFWGVDSVSDVPDGYVQGIAESMAAELLEAMIQTGAIRVIQVTFRGTPEGTQIAVEGSKKDKVITVSNQYVVEGGKHNVDFYTSNDITDTQALVELAPTLIEKVVLVTPDDVQFIGDSRPPVAKTQLRNPVVDNTPDQIAMIKVEQKTPHYINQPMVDLYQALGLDKILQLFGSGDLDGRPLNQNHKLGLEGKNRTITGAFNHLMSVVNEVKLSAGDDAIDQVPIRYAYNINKVGRLQMLGRYNPQSTKLIREAILPTRSTLNLSNENSTDYGKFMLAVAQAIGQKVHKQSLNTSIDATMKELNGSLAPVVQMLKDFHTTGKMDAGFVEAIKKGLGSNLTTVALNALSEYARLQITEDRSSFTTPLYVEADGVTNGPINAMALLSIGNFTPDWVNRMRKGGLSFFGPKTMNDIHTTAGPGGDQSDMYQTTTDVMKGLFVKMSQEMKDPRAKAQMNHLVQMLDLFLPDFEIKDNQLVMKRGIAKNPLTITIYGSGAKGIAGKITDAVLEQLYERLSEVMERQGANSELSMAEAMFGHKATDKESAEQMMERFTSAYEALTTYQIAKGKNGYFIVKGDNTLSLTAMNKPEFTLDKGRVNNLKANMRKLFVDPMREAIESTVGKPLMDAASLVQKATQIQSVFQQVMFNQAVKDAIAEKLKTNPAAKSEGLSRIEQDTILRQVLKQFPLIQTGKQSFFIAGSQSTDVNTTMYGTSTTDTFRTPGFVYGPTDAGVAGIPTMVIGSGDGMMMQILSIMKNSPIGSLKIFDGVNFPLDKLEESSKAANKAVYESWQGNPLQAVYEMFAASKFDVSQMPTSVLKDLARTLGVKESTVGDIQQGLNALRYTLEQAALSAEARHTVMRKVDHSIDQMASGGWPYEHFGIVLKGKTDEDIARELDRLYVIELAQLMKDAKERKPEDSSNNSAATTASAKPSSLAPKVSTPVAASTPTPVLKTSGTFTPKNAEQAEGINKIQEFLSPSNTTERVFVLEGKAGTGKTTIMQEALRKVLTSGQTVTIAAVSHKAKTVLDQKLKGFVKSNNLRGNVKAYSVAGLFSMVLDRKTGNFKIDSDKVGMSPITKAQVLVVDEASMIDQKNLDLIMKYLPPGTKVVFLGDIGQLAPISPEAKISPIFTMKVPRFKLLERVRQGEDSSILPYADTYWNNSQASNAVRNPVSVESRKSTNELKFYSSLNRTLRDYMGLFKQAVANRDPTLVKIVAYNNKEGNAKAAESLRELERRIRVSLFGSNPKEFEKGELVILDNNFRYEEPGSDEKITLENSREFSVSASSPGVLEIRGESFPTTNVTLDSESTNERYEVPVLSRDPAVQNRWRAMFNTWAGEINAMSGNAKREAWATFYDAKESVAPLSYGYVLTSHKAQGSTYGTSIVLEDNFLSASMETPENISRAIYTAITRASNQAVIVSKLNPAQEDSTIAAALFKTSDDSAILGIGEKHPTGVKVLNNQSLNTLIRKMGLSPALQAVYDRIRIAGAVQDYTVVHGTVEQLVAYADAEIRTILTPAQFQAMGTVRGFIVPGDKIVYLVTPSEETLIHELIHASTYETVQAVLDDKETNPNIISAVNRIQELLKQFENLTWSDVSDISNGYLDTLSSIRSQRASGNEAAAINEFMAWSLTNQAVISKLKGTKASPLVQLAKDVIQAIKQLVFGTSKLPEVGEDMFSNLLFNTSIIIQTQPTLQSQMDKTILFQSVPFGNNQRLADLDKLFNQVIGKYLASNPKDLPLNESKVQVAIKNAIIIADNVIARGIPMSPQERSTFHTIVAAMATEATIDPHSMAMAQTLYVHVAGSLNVQDKFGILANGGVDAQGRSSILPVFLALAMVNDDFRQLLATMPLPKSVLQDWNTLDGVLTNAGTIAMDSLASRLSGTNNTTNIQDAIDALSNQIRKTTTDRAGLVDMLSNTSNGAVDWVNDKVIQGVEAMAGVATQGAEKLETGAPSRLTKFMADAARITEKLVNERDADQVSEGIMSKINRIKGFSPFRDMVTDLVGRTMNNKAVYDLIKAIRSHVQQDRQNYRDEVPKIIAEKFTRRLKDTEWSTLFRGLGKTDLAALRAQYSVSEILGFISEPALVKKTIGELQSQLKKADAAHFNKVDQKAKQLATYMMTGKPGTKLLRNADAISHLLFERTQKGRAAPDAAYISQVDQLVTLYALEMLNQTDMKSLVSLVQNERQGMEFSLSYLVGQREEETRKSINGRARFNSYKGYIPSLQQEGVSLLVANDTDHADMLSKSYVRVGAYSGSDAEGIIGRKSYYFAPVSAMATFNQGIMQNVRQTAGGVETTTGFTEGMTAGRITDKLTVDRITKRMMLEGSNTTENLMPVYDNAGVVVAYERSIDPTQMVKLNHDTNLAKMIGVWRGRQVEEGKAQEFNETLIDALHTMWTNEKSAKRGEYVNLWDPKTLADDPVLNDALALMNAETRAYVEDKFGDEFWVRRDMLNDAFGYRNASMGDAWTGNTRWNETFQENFKNLAITVMGNRAYKTLVNGEKFLQKTVATAKTLIVVKSVVVTAGNLLSNMYQLVANGISPVVIAKATPKKLAEVQAYMTSRKKEVRLEADLRAAEGNSIRERKLSAELTTIRDSYKRMSIWPLIKAGELSAISHDVSQNDMLLNGKFEEYFEQLVDKLPGPLQTAGRYALITKDTALFQGLSKSIEYGDFIAKAILYDHLTVKKGRTSEEALGHITEEFVNYDRLPGRFRGYVEGIGMLWFWSFKIRSVKVALRMIRSNPVRALLTEVLPHPGGFKTGSPISDNLIGKLMDGTLGYSVGPGMGFRAPMLNPWTNLAF